MSDFPSSKFERGKIFAKTGLKVGSNYAKYHLQKVIDKKDTDDKKKDLQSRNANDMYKEFAKLRGTALKIAQSLSMDTSGLLSDEFIEVMSQSQYRVPPINKALVRSIIKNELGGYPEKLFKSFNIDALAAASIGQVHEAVLKDGRKVAIKIQYPNIRDTIQSDLTMAKVLFKRMIKGRNIDQYFQEVKDRLTEETDYIHEGKQIEFFAEKYTSNKFITPRWVQELSTDKVLTMTYLEGQHLDAFLASDPSQVDRNLYGQLLWDFFHEQINEAHTIHADAHPGNFMFTPDRQLGILDFGCVKTFPADFFYDYMYSLPAHIKGDSDELFRLYKKLEMLSLSKKGQKKEHEYFQFFKEFGNAFIQPYRSEQFDFSNQNFKRQLNFYIKKATTFDEPVGSKHFVYASRVHMGLYNMLMQLKAVVDTKKSLKIVNAFLERNKHNSTVINES
jgi:predicted unusual protein kinase regulating ubiquinone biosynthesis (AarF/ABC1/UbiB family)